MTVDPKYSEWLMHCWLQIGDQAIMGADMWAESAPDIDKPKNGFDVTVDDPRRSKNRGLDAVRL